MAIFKKTTSADANGVDVEAARTAAIDTAALEGIKKQAKVFQAIIDVTEILESISSIDGAVNEANRRLAMAREQEGALSSTLSKLQGEIDGLTSQKAGHLGKIQSLLADANTDAKAIVDNAKDKSSQMLVEARGSAEKIVNDANARAQECDKQTAEARLQLASITADIGRASTEYNKLQAAIDSLKAKFS